MLRFWSVVFVLSALLSCPALAGSAPKVVVSVQPLAFLVAAVMDGVATPAVLVSGQASEHGYALKPSQMRQIQGADLVVMVNPQYEAFLDKAVAQRPKKTLLIASEQKGMILYARGDHHDHDGSDHHHGAGGPAEDGGALDGHLWLDPVNAEILAQAVTTRLGELDPDHREHYQANMNRLAETLRGLDAALAQQLAPVRDRPFVVFHDAWQYLVRRYGLRQVGVLAVDPDRPVSARRLAAVRKTLRETGAVCVFHEPQFPSPLVEQVAAEHDLRTGVLDPQGAGLPVAAGQYERFMNLLRDGLLQCLTPQTPS